MITWLSACFWQATSHCDKLHQRRHQLVSALESCDERCSYRQPLRRDDHSSAVSAIVVLKAYHQSQHQSQQLSLIMRSILLTDQAPQRPQSRKVVWLTTTMFHRHDDHGPALTKCGCAQLTTEQAAEMLRERLADSNSTYNRFINPSPH